MLNYYRAKRNYKKVQQGNEKYILFLTKGIPFVYLPLKGCTPFIYLLHENKSVRKEVFRSFSWPYGVFLRSILKKGPLKYLMKDFPLLSHTSTFDFPTLCYTWCLKEVRFRRRLPDYENCIMKSWTGDEWTFGHGRWLKTDAIIDDTI